MTKPMIFFNNPQWIGLFFASLTLTMYQVPYKRWHAAVDRSYFVLAMALDSLVVCYRLEQSMTLMILQQYRPTCTFE